MFGISRRKHALLTVLKRALFPHALDGQFYFLNEIESGTHIFEDLCVDQLIFLKLNYAGKKPHYRCETNGVKIR